MQATLKGLNAAMQKEGIDAELVKGRGYFYFADFPEDVLEIESIYIYALNHCDHDEWMKHIRSAWKHRSMVDWSLTKCSECEGTNANHERGCRYFALMPQQEQTS